MNRLQQLPRWRAPLARVRVPREALEKPRGARVHALRAGAAGLELVDLRLGDLALRFVQIKQGRHVLRLRLVLIRMQREKLVHELCVGDGRRIEDDLDRFAVAGLAGADLAVRWRVCLATGIADTRRTYAPEPLECGLRGPESAECEVCDLGVAASGVNSVLGGHLGRFAMSGAHAGSGSSFLSNSGARVAVSSTRLLHEGINAQARKLLEFYSFYTTALGTRRQ